MSGKYVGGIVAGSTSVTVGVVLRKTADNTELTGLAYGSVTAYYQRQGAAPVAITLAVIAADATAWSAGGWFESDATHKPGRYRLDVPDAAFATGADFVEINVYATGSYVFYEQFALSTGVLQTGDSYARLGAPAGASVSADILTANTSIGSGLGTAVAAISTSVGSGLGTAVATISTSVGSGLGTAVATISTSVGSGLGTAVATISTSVGSGLGAAVASMSNVIRTGTAQAGTATTTTLDSGASAIDNFYVGNNLEIDSGTGANRAVVAITGYVGATKVATHATGTAADNTSVFTLRRAAPASMGQLPSNGLDLITVETGINFRQAMSPVLAAAAGVLSGATTSTVAIAAAGTPATVRVTASVDGSGNRTAVTLNLPA